MTSRHVIEWHFDKFMAQVVGKVVCQSDPDEVCRTKPSHLSGCECEEFVNVARDDRGWYHVREGIIHRHEPTDECNIESWMNEDPMVFIMEMYVGEQHEIPLATTVIEPVWGGEGYEWKLPAATA
jgi:hypothetical protein